MRNVRRILPVVRRSTTHAWVPARFYSIPVAVTNTQVRSFEQNDFDAVKEWARKNFGSLRDPKNKPDEAWALQAISVPSVLECIAEINGTEFAFKKLDPKVLLEKYKEQLDNFEAVRRKQLEKDGVSGVVIDHLHDIFKFRAAVPMWELTRAVSELGFLGEQSLRVTRRELEQRPVWKAARIRTPFSSENFHPSYDEAGLSNEEAAAANVRRFKGMRGALNAFTKGLTAEQYDHVLKTVEKHSVSPAQHEEIAARIAQIRNSPKGDVKAEMKKLVEEYPPGTPQYTHLKELVAYDRISASNTVPHTVSSYGSLMPAPPTAEDFKKNVKKALAAALEKAPEMKERYAVLEEVINHATQPEELKKLKLINSLASNTLSEKAKDELLAPFVEGGGGNHEDDLLNDVLNAHPLAARLWGNRVAWLSTENINYTKRYQENHDNGLYKDVSSSPLYEEAMKSSYFDSPTIAAFPFNTGLEEVQHMKLLALANTLGFDLKTDIGVAQFDSFLHSYDVSPGESTLDRVHDYPPPAHTYEELPIIKFAGFDEADVPEDYEEYVESQKAKSQ